MATVSERVGARAASDFRSIFTHARTSLREDAAGVRELQLALDRPPLRARSRILTSGALTFVRGENRADTDLTLRHEDTAPIIALHLPLRGGASSTVEGLRANRVERVGTLQLLATPPTRSVTRLPAGVTNEAFRITLSPSMLDALAARHPPLEALARQVAASAFFCGPAVDHPPLPRLLDEIAEILDSDRYGSLRPLFLESRALSWLARALAAPRARSDGADEDALPPRERDRMQEARDLLLSRLASPPTLAEVAAAIGTNDFALKRNFKRVFGQPVHAYLLGVRLAHAGRLLRDTSRSVKEIAGEVGYAHPNHFCTAFRRIHGLSPGAFRAAARGQRR